MHEKSWVRKLTNSNLRNDELNNLDCAYWGFEIND